MNDFFLILSILKFLVFNLLIRYNTQVVQFKTVRTLNSIARPAASDQHPTKITLELYGIPPAYRTHL